jgi:lysophospholipid hydrolase
VPASTTIWTSFVRRAWPAFPDSDPDSVSAIRIFGYLEKPVFHELARHLQTRRLVAGDTLCLESDPSFYIVVDGTVQVFVPDHRTSASKNEPSKRLPGDSSAAEAYDHEATSGLQLLNEVSSGGTLSSLFTILSLFTEQIKLRYEEEPKVSSPSNFRQKGGGDHDISQFNLDEEALDEAESSELDDNSPPHHDAKHRRSSDSATQDPDLRRIPSASSLHTVTDRGNASFTKSPRRGKSARSLLSQPPKQSIIARAKTDTTLAVIPAYAFRHLTKKFPNAAAHIVQVILTRLARVTLLTSHRYLGLTKEIVRTEKAINDLACYPLPAEFYMSGGMHRLRQRFVPETTVESPEDTVDYFSLDPPSPMYGPSLGRAASRHASDTSPMNGVKLRYQPKTPSANVRSKSSRANPLSFASLAISPDKTPPRANVPLPMHNKKPSVASRTLSFIDHHEFDLRTAVMECISKSMGLVSSMTSGLNSAEQSPMLSPQTSSTPPPTRPAFNSSFGSLSYLRTQSKDDESSVTAASSHARDTPSELENEVEILFFSKGSSLVKEGQSNAGVFYVIDGFLDVSMSKSQVQPMVDLFAGQPSANETPKAKRSAATATATGEDSTEAFPLFAVKPGGIAGYLASLTGYASYVSITAKTDVYVGFLPAAALERMMDRRPVVLLTLAKRLLSLLSPLILHIDLALEWVQVNAGQVVYKEGEEADSFYICIQGRVRAISEKRGGGVEIKGEYGQGESVGELECITKSRRPNTLHAIRDTEVRVALLSNGAEIAVSSSACRHSSSTPSQFVIPPSPFK